MSQSTFAQLEKNVIRWATERQLLSTHGDALNSDAKSQLLKTVSEIGELADAVNQNNAIDIQDALGDVIVTLIILNQLTQGKYSSITQCLEIAYNQIKDRTGSLINGVFVKDNPNSVSKADKIITTIYEPNQPNSLP